MTEGLNELKAMQEAYTALEPLDADGRTRAVRWLVDALGIDRNGFGGDRNGTGNLNEPPVDTGSGQAPTPREFIAQKKPTTSVERLACLGYYLSHYRNKTKFKTNDLTSLNTEAAAPRFGNATRDVDNADRASGYLVSAGAGVKQLTVRGEALVLALPNRDAVKQALAEHPHKRKKATGSSKKASAPE